jgi:adenylate kinase
VFIGPPGSGKSTVGNALRLANLAQHISTGELIRDYMRQMVGQHTSIGESLSTGGMVSDDEVTALLVEQMERTQAPRIILDGYPRTMPQIALLESIMKRFGRSLNAVVQFKLPDEDAILRVCGRYNCRSCSRSYHSVFKPAVDGACECGETQFVQRAHDLREIVEARLHKYHLMTEPIADAYRDRGLLKVVDASLPIDQVINNVLDVI